MRASFAVREVAFRRRFPDSWRRTGDGVMAMGTLDASRGRNPRIIKILWLRQKEPVNAGPMDSMEDPMYPHVLRAAALLLTLFFASSGLAADEPASRSIFGWVERVEIFPEGISLKAKMDTGATTSSLNALNKEAFRRDGERWIAFDIIDPETPDSKVRLERKVTRYVRIIRHDGEHQRRPVVTIGLCMGSVYREEEMNLVDRTQLNYQALVGRNHMAGAIVVDPAETFTQSPRCALPEGVPDPTGLHPAVDPSAYDAAPAAGKRHVARGL